MTKEFIIEIAISTIKKKKFNEILTQCIIIIIRSYRRLKRLYILTYIFSESA